MSRKVWAQVFIYDIAVCPQCQTLSLPVASGMPAAKCRICSFHSHSMRCTNCSQFYMTKDCQFHNAVCICRTCAGARGLGVRRGCQLRRF